MIPAFLSGVIACYAWRRRSIPGATIIFFLMLGASVAVFAHGMELMSLALPDKLIWVKIRYMGTALIYPMLLLLALWYTNRRQWLTVRGVMLLFILPVFSLAALFTDNLHHLHYASLGLDTDGPFPMITVTTGPLYWFYVIHSFVYNIVALVILLKAHVHASLVSRRQTATLIIGTALPVLAGMLYMIGVRPFGGLNILSFAYSFSSLVFAWAIIDRQLLDLRPIARGMIFDSMTDGFVVLNNQLSIVDANPVAVRLLNLTRDHIGQHGNKAFLESPTLVRLIHTEPHSHIQVEIGEQFFDASRTSLFDDRQNLIGHLISLRDITSIKRSEEVLKESEKKFRFLAENMNDILWIMDMKLQTVYVTPSIEAVLGFTREERKRQSAQEQLTPGSLSIAMQALARELALENKGQSDPNRKATLILEFYHKDGSTRWLETIISGIRDDQGVLTGLYGLSRDITERKRMEEQLRESEERYRSLVENSDEAILVIQDGMIKFVNTRVVESFGYSVQELLSIPVFELIHPEDRNAVMERYLQKIGGDTTRTRHTCRSIYKGDQTAWIEIGSILIDWDGRPATLNLITDITERKQAEAQREKLIADLQRATLEVGTLSGLLPICASCKKIRNDKGYWERIEQYIGDRSTATFSHGICPECAQKSYPEMDQKK